MNFNLEIFGKVNSGLTFVHNEIQDKQIGSLQLIFNFYSTMNAPERSMRKRFLTYSEIDLANTTLNLAEILCFAKDFGIIPKLLTTQGLNFAWQRQRQKTIPILLRKNRIDYDNFVEILARCSVLCYSDPTLTHVQRAKTMSEFLGLSDHSAIKEKLKKIRLKREEGTLRREVLYKMKVVIRKPKKKDNLKKSFKKLKEEIDLFDKKILPEQFKAEVFPQNNTKNQNKMLRRQTFGSTIRSVVRCSVQMSRSKSIFKENINLMNLLNKTRKTKKKTFSRSRKRKSFFTQSIDAQFSKETLQIFRNYEKQTSFNDKWRQLPFKDCKLTLPLITKRKYLFQLRITSLFTKSIFFDYDLINLPNCSILFDGKKKMKGLTSTALLEICFKTEIQLNGKIIIKALQQGAETKLECLETCEVELDISARECRVKCLV